MQKMKFFTTDFLIFCNWELGCNQYPINTYHNVLSSPYFSAHPIHFIRCFISIPYSLLSISFNLHIFKKNN